MEDFYEKIADLLQAVRISGIEQVQDYEKFNHYAIVHHSTVIEGSTLTEIETQLLLDQGLSPAGKPMLHAHMVQDHFAALQFVLGQAHQPLSPNLIRQINAAVMRQTGSVYQTALGTVDASRASCVQATCGQATAIL